MFSNLTTILQNVEQSIENIRPTCPRKSKTVIAGLKKSKTSGYDLITAEEIGDIPYLAIVKLMRQYDWNLRPSYWNVAEVILVSKPGKPATDVMSYRPISLLPVLSKILEKILQSRIQIIINSKNIIPNRFGFRKQHAIIQQVHKICDTIGNLLKRKKSAQRFF